MEKISCNRNTIKRRIEKASFKEIKLKRQRSNDNVSFSPTIYFKCNTLLAFVSSKFFS